ncbi:hypothetical protein FJ651_07730 [Paucihalobacter ruber]|uniref:Alpha/beta hydrolase n=1 Tax=Paucihalobacter ruber TaxID=2567861 RepID=A0A506PPE4_9FLAO|nr:hypothetical protein [Paucihalobacter ruber]TPV34040.1 hypothetical protein FJ651_07730 [Paucihalobacter ruber]
MDNIKIGHFTIALLLMFMLTACDNGTDDTSEINPNFNESTTGSGIFEFDYTTESSSKTLRVFYHIPVTKTPSTKIMMVFHGANRNASDYRNTLIAKSNEYNFIVIVPEFSEANFPGGDQYNLGNVYVDGDNPTANTLNPESEWTFSIIETLFDYVKTQLGNTNNTYKIFGHSAGAQFAHRFLMFKPNNRSQQTVISAAGWYTFPDLTVNFPYGFKNSMLQTSSREILFSKNVTVQIGENDNNPNAAGLRHNTTVDMQGINRLERAVNYYNFCVQSAQTLNVDFNWSFSLRPNADHDYTSAAQDAAVTLFN